MLSDYSPEGDKKKENYVGGFNQYCHHFSFKGIL